MKRSGDGLAWNPKCSKKLSGVFAMSFQSKLERLQKINEITKHQCYFRFKFDVVSFFKTIIWNNDNES